ncbi:MAG: HAMP domain-containing sensor histidine kinase [Candidatus Margulisiibacteriota bacterium]
MFGDNFIMAVPEMDKFNSKDNPEKSNEHKILNFLDYVSDVQKHLIEVEAMLNKLRIAGDKTATINLIHQMAGEDKGTLQKLIRFIRKYDHGPRIESSTYDQHTRKHEIETDEFSDKYTAQLDNTIHDLRSGLAGLFGYIQMIEKGRIANRENKVFSGINKTVKYVEGLIEETINDTDIQKPYKHLNITSILRKAVKISGLNHSRPILLTDNASVMGNEIQLERVFSNLLENSYQAMEDVNKGIVVIQSFTRNDKVIILISDNGIGVPEENLKKIFYNNFTTKPYGKGLGLVICKTIVEDHLGEIIVESNYRHGTTFIIQLPKA